MTPILLAIDLGKTDAIRFLICSGVNVNLKDRWNQTALHLAAGRNDPETVKLLLAAGADLKAKAISGRTAYGFAADNGFTAVAVLLKKAGRTK